ncbi:MAG: PA14 domain-containing protein, partial [Chloroflexi bacterium]|nr:PA14 domain-containing protein [Chloroflexota bacterium]
MGSSQWQTVYGYPGLTLDVDPIGYDENTPQADHVISVGTGTRLDFWNGSGTSSLRSASFTDATGISHKPVAYIRQEGDGRINVYGGAGIDAGDTGAARIYHWTVAGGVLNGSEEGGLGADAYGWVFNDKRPTIANQHLEGIMVESGATLEWAGTHGFLSASQWPTAAPAEQGNGFNAGEFRMQDNTTLRGNNLRLGFYQTYTPPDTGAPVTDTYLCYPTIEAPGATSIALGGTIRFDSGIARDGPGPLNVTVTGGDISLIDRLDGAIGTEVINSLTHQAGTTRIGNQQTTMTDTTINGGALVFQPTAAIAYNGSVTLNAGQIQAATGETDLGSTIGVSTAPPPVYTNDVLLEQFYDGLDGVTGPVAEGGNLFGPLMGAGFDPYTAAFWKASANLDYPGNADSVDTQPWVEADGSVTLDHAGTPIIMADSDQMGFRATGELMIDSAGTYAFRTASDDGTKLWIDNQVVVDNDYWQGFTWREGTIYMDAGPHSFAVGFYEGGGGAGFEVQWDPAGGTAWTAIPADRFRYADGASDGILMVE